MEPIDRIAELRRQIEYETLEIRDCKVLACVDCVDAKFGLEMAQDELNFLMAEHHIYPPHPDEPNAAREWYLSTQVK